MMVSKAKPYHDLLPHLIDAWEVFNHYWRHQKPFLSTFCQRYGLEMKEVYALLSLAVYLHDIGKTNQQWQIYLEGSKNKPKFRIHCYHLQPVGVCLSSGMEKVFTRMFCFARYSLVYWLIIICCIKIAINM